jgi:hypothetical protein
MPDFILLMHDDAPGEARLDWDPYLTKLRESGVFQGGSSIGDGACVRREGATPQTTAHLSGFVRVSARDFDHAKSLLAGCPVYEAGGTVEIRELPRGS